MMNGRADSEGYVCTTFEKLLSTHTLKTVYCTYFGSTHYDPTGPLWVIPIQTFPMFYKSYGFPRLRLGVCQRVLLHSFTLLPGEKQRQPETQHEKLWKSPTPGVLKCESFQHPTGDSQMLTGSWENLFAFFWNYIFMGKKGGCGSFSSKRKTIAAFSQKIWTKTCTAYLNVLRCAGNKFGLVSPRTSVSALLRFHWAHVAWELMGAIVNLRVYFENLQLKLKFSKFWLFG